MPFHSFLVAFGCKVVWVSAQAGVGDDGTSKLTIGFVFIAMVSFKS